MRTCRPVRDLLADAIRNNNVGAVRELLDLQYRGLEVFLVAIKAHGLVYSADAATSEDRLIGGWPLVSRTERLYYTLIDIVMQSSDLEIVTEFVRWPFRLMCLALAQRDHLIFQGFASVFPYLYRAAKAGGTPAIQSYVYDRCCRLLVEFDHYHVAPSARVCRS